MIKLLLFCVRFIYDSVVGCILPLFKWYEIDYEGEDGYYIVKTKMFMAQSTKRFSQYMDSNSTVYQIVLMNLVNKLISVKPEKHSILELC